jgi:UDP-N-acetylglucosamine 2-epimerase (non-hydrolysing)
MRIVTVLGTRPEVIRLSLILQKLDQLAEEHILVHTGQNFTPTLKEVFFTELGLRAPDYTLSGAGQSLGGQLSALFRELEVILLDKQPDAMLVLGDTNSALSALLAERMGIPVVHMEAGNRCYDNAVPEEKNRRVIDAISSFNLPYTPGSRENLLREGIAPSRLLWCGNPIYEVLTQYAQQIAASASLERLGLTPNDYFLATVHRAENVDHPAHLTEIVNGLNRVAANYGKRIVCSLHPRTKSRLAALPELTFHPLIELYEPFGFFDFVRLEQQAYCALTDSGTVQEECCLFHVPTVTLRRTTERPETVDCGSNAVSGLHAQKIEQAVQAMTSLSRSWRIPAGYEEPNVSAKVVKFLSTCWQGGLRNVYQ